MNIRKIVTFPARNLLYVVPADILVALVCGYFWDTSALKALILPVAVMTIYPAMIGFQPKELFRLSELRLAGVNLLLNFFVLPLAALLIGKIFLGPWPELRTGLLLISVIPGGNMAIPFTMLFGGNVKASFKICAGNLILGSLLAPLYLYILAGTMVEVNLLQVAKTIVVVVFLPLCMGMVTYSLLRKRLSQKEFEQKIKPFLPALSAWGLVYIVFTSVSMKAQMIFGHPELIVQAMISLILWYAGIFVLCVLIGRALFCREDSITLLLNVELRNLAIAIGLAVTAFSSQTAMMVAMGFLFQQQFAIWFFKLEQRHQLLGRDRKSSRVR